MISFPGWLRFNRIEFVVLFVMAAAFLSSLDANAAIPGTASPDAIWTEEALRPAARAGREPHVKTSSYRAFRVNLARLRTDLAKAPRERAGAARQPQTIVTIPTPTGEFARFQIEESPVFSAELAAQHPEYASYTGKGLDDPAATLRASVTPNGFYAQILSPGKSFYVDPYDASDTEFCVSYRREDARAQPGFQCVAEPTKQELEQQAAIEERAAAKPSASANLTSGGSVRTYRLVVTATGEYTRYQNSNGPGVLPAIYSAVDRLIGLYRNELSLSFTLVGVQFYDDPNTDPFDESNTTQCLTANQTTIDSLMGDANYDIGHLFGVNISSAAKAGVCQSGLKAQGATGRNPPTGDPFVVDYVAHEIGHQFSASHTFNSISGGCSGNRVASSAYERGSGTTIMGYASLCSPDDTQLNSDPYFHVQSLMQIKNYTTPGVGLGDCPPASNTGNTVPSAYAGPNYSIPKQTPFKLTGSGSDAESFAVSFCWEQRDLGPAQLLSAADNGSSPLFRSTRPVDGTSSRIFPRLAERGTNSDPAFHEVLPSLGRVMDFRLTVRDHDTFGAFATDDTAITVVGTAGPFAVTSPNTTNVVWPGGSYQTVTWSVNDTDKSPISCNFVEIWLSLDDGVTYTNVLAGIAPNNGSARIVVPSVPVTSTTCRLMVKAQNNIFFDVSDAPFRIAPAVIPANNNIVSAQNLGTSHSGSVNGSNINATAEAGEPRHYNITPGPLYTGGRSVWYKWTPAAGGVTTFTRSGEVYGVRAVYLAGSSWNGVQTPYLATALNDDPLTFTAMVGRTYYIAFDGLHDQDFGSFQLNWSTVVDSTPPVIGFSPLTNQQVVFNFEQLGGTVSEPSTVKFKIEWYKSGANEFWNGVNWSSVGGAAAELPANLSGLNWTPAPGALPPRAQAAQGNYVIHALVTDAAGNTNYNNLVVVRSPQDTTAPIVSINLDEGQEFTNRFLPTLLGLAGDPESGVDMVTMYFSRRVPGGFEYWNGSSWSTSASPVTLTYQDFVWGMPSGTLQPSGSNLRNGSYNIQVLARNREAPPLSGSVSVNFTVDYHPVFVWTQGSYTDNISGNENLRWDNPANWDALDVPSPDAIVIIPGGSPDNTSLGSLNLYRLDMSGGALNTSGMLIQKLNLSGGTLAGGTINLTTNGAFVWSGGTLVGTYGIPTNATLRIIDQGNLYLGSNTTLENEGTITWTNSMTIHAARGAVINNRGVFEIQGNGQFFNYTGGDPVPTFNNHGILRKTAGTNGTYFPASNGGWLFNHWGTLDVQTGSVGIQTRANFQNGATFSGSGVTRIEGNATTLSGTSTILSGGKVELAGGTLAGTGSFIGAGTFYWSSGSASGEHTIGARLFITGANDKAMAGRLVNTSTNGVWTGTGTLTFRAGSVFQNTGSLQADTDAAAYNITGGTPIPRFQNTGTFIKSGGTNETLFHAANGGVAFDNAGIILAQTGTIALGGGGSHSNGTFNATSGARIELYAGSHSIDAAATFTGAGRTRITGGGVTINNCTNIVSSGGTFELASGSLSGNGGLAGLGTFNWSGGQISGALALQSNLTTTCSGAADKQLAAGTISNFGTLIWTGTGLVRASANSGIHNHGTFNLQNDSGFFNYTGGSPNPLLNNIGTIRKTVATGETVVRAENNGWVFANSGLVDIQTGVLSSRSQFNLNANGTFSGAGVTRIDGGIATMSGSNSIATGGSLELASGTMNGTGTYHGPGTLEWSGGTLQGNLGVGTATRLLISGNSGKQLAGSFSNAGQGIWRGAADVNVSAGSVFNNSGSFTAENGAQFYNNTGGSPQPAFNNTGLFVKAGATNPTTFSGANGGMSFNNSGTTAAQTGLLALSGGGVSSNATFNALGNARIELSGGTHTVNGGLTFTGAGATRITGAAFNAIGGTNTISGGATLELAAGSLNGSTTFAGPGALAWTGGGISATLNLQADLAFDISGAATKVLEAGVIHNAGTATWTGAGVIYGRAGGLLDNSGTLNIQNDSQFYNFTGGSPSPAINNTGTIRKTGASGDTLISSANGGWVFSNSGVMDIQTGALLSAAHFIVNPGGSYSGAGVTRIVGSVALNGASALAGGKFELASGVLFGSGTFNGNGAFLWTAGEIHGTLAIGSATSLLISGDAGRQLRGSITNTGTATWTGTGTINCSAGSSFHNGGTFIAQNDAPFYNNTGGAPIPTFYNTGTFQKIGATGATVFSGANGGVTFDSSGSVDLRSGTLAIHAGYVTSPSALLKISLGGSSQGTQFGTESFAGNAIFAGGLVLSLTNGFTPTNGSSFTLATYPSRTGQFTTAQFPPLPVELKWRLTYAPNALLAEVVPATAFQFASLSNGNFQVRFVGESGSACRIDVSTNLVDWVPLQTNSPFNGALEYVDPQTSQHPKRFYRATIFP